MGLREKEEAQDDRVGGTRLYKKYQRFYVMLNPASFGFNISYV